MDEEDQEGRKPWLVANFPVDLRREITREAGKLKITVAEWLVAHFEQHGIAGVTFVSRDGTKLDSKLIAKPVSTDSLVNIAASPSIQRWLRRHAARELAQRMGVEPPAIKPPKRLPPPGPGDTVASRTLNT
jgi:hypothetical protein